MIPAFIFVKEICIFSFMFRLKIIVGILLTTLGVKVNGQEFMPGTILSKSGQSINGYIKNMNGEDYLFKSKIKYRLSEHGKTLGIDRDSIQEMKVKGEVYLSMNIIDDSIKKKMDLLWLLVDGPLKYYMGVKDKNYAYSIGANGASTVEAGVEKGYYLQKGNDLLFWPRYSWFNKDLKEYFNDDPELADKIGTKGYMPKDMKKIVMEYNQRHSK